MSDRDPDKRERIAGRAPCDPAGEALARISKGLTLANTGAGRLAGFDAGARMARLTVSPARLVAGETVASVLSARTASVGSRLQLPRGLARERPLDLRHQLAGPLFGGSSLPRLPSSSRPESVARMTRNIANIGAAVAVPPFGSLASSLTAAQATSFEATIGASPGARGGSGQLLATSRIAFGPSASGALDRFLGRTAGFGQSSSMVKLVTGRRAADALDGFLRGIPNLRETGAIAPVGPSTSVRGDGDVQRAALRVGRALKGQVIYHVVRRLSLGTVRRLDGLGPAEVEGLVFDALALAIQNPAVAGCLIAAIRDAEILATERRDDLEHGLAHVHAGEFGKALPPLCHGVEGAFWDAAEAAGIVDGEHYFCDRSAEGGRRAKRASGVEQVFGPLGFTDTDDDWLRRRAFGTRGNPYRHGYARGGRREQSLCLVVALITWLARFGDGSAGRPVYRQLDHHLLVIVSA